MKTNPYYYIDHEDIRLLGGECDGYKITVKRGVNRVMLPIAAHPAIGVSRTFYAVTYRRAAETNIFTKERYEH